MFKTINLRNAAIKVLVCAIVLTFVVLAVIHVISLTNQGLINWKY